MKYEILWHDAEDERTGTSFEVEANNVIEGYYAAQKHITGLSEILARRFCPGDIEALIDEQGISHYPWDFCRNASDEELRIAREMFYGKKED